MPFWKHLLWPFAILWGLGSAIRNLLYKIDFLSSAQFEIPVISIGNLSMGGSGKTPHTEYFIYHFREIFNIAILSRGYRRKTSGFRIAQSNDNYLAIGDEPRQIKAKFPGVAVAVGENRAFAIPNLLQKVPQTNLIILDDAYQHLSVKPALNVLLTPYHMPFWKDYLFPVGWLREPRKNVNRANVIVVTKCPDNLSVSDEKSIKEQFQPLEGQKMFFSKFDYLTPYQLFYPQNRQPLNTNLTVLLFSGIADGELLREYLESEVEEVFWVEFDDHYNYEQRDLETLKTAYGNIDTPNKLIITTEKDAVRLEPYTEWLIKEQLPIFCLPVKVSFTGSNKDEFNDLVLQFIEFYRSGGDGDGDE